MENGMIYLVGLRHGGNLGRDELRLFTSWEKTVQYARQIGTITCPNGKTYRNSHGLRIYMGKESEALTLVSRAEREELLR